MSAGPKFDHGRCTCTANDCRGADRCGHCQAGGDVVVLAAPRARPEVEAAYLRGRDEVRATVRVLEDRITALEAELRAATVRHGGGQG